MVVQSGPTYPSVTFSQGPDIGTVRVWMAVSPPPTADPRNHHRVKMGTTPSLALPCRSCRPPTPPSLAPGCDAPRLRLLLNAVP